MKNCETDIAIFAAISRIQAYVAWVRVRRVRVPVKDTWFLKKTGYGNVT